MGTLATELNESDSLLISQLYLIPETRDLEPEELLVVLAGCILDGKKEEVNIEDIKIPRKVKDTLYTLSDIWDKSRFVEDDNGSTLYPW